MIAAIYARKSTEQSVYVYACPRARVSLCANDLGVTPTLGRFLAAVPTLKQAGTSPTGFEPVFWP